MNNYTQITKYFENSLSASEKDEFDKLLATDTEFAKEFQFQKDLKEAIKLNERANLKKELQDLELHSRPKSYKKWLVAASVAVVFSFLGYYFFQLKPTTQELFAENFEPYRNIIHPIVRGEQSDLKTLAFVAYENENFKEASKLLEKLYSEEKNSAYLFYQGISLMKENKTDEAITIFKKQLESQDKFTNKTNWYLALCYLKKEDITTSQSFLEKVITSDEVSKKEKAKKLLQQIK